MTMIVLYYLFALIVFPIISFLTAAIFHQLIGMYGKYIWKNYDYEEERPVNFITKCFGFYVGAVSTMILTHFLFRELLTYYIILPFFFFSSLYRRNSDTNQMEPVEYSTILALVLALALSYFSITNNIFGYKI